MSGDIRQPWEILEQRITKKLDELQGEVSSVRTDFRNELKELQKTVTEIDKGHEVTKDGTGKNWALILLILGVVAGSGGLVVWSNLTLSSQVGGIDERTKTQQTAIEKLTTVTQSIEKSSESLRSDFEAKSKVIAEEVNAFKTAQSATNERLTSIEKQNKTLSEKVAELSNEFEDVIKKEEARTQAAITAAQQAVRAESINRTVGVLLTIRELTNEDPGHLAFQAKLPAAAGANAGQVRESAITLTVVKADTPGADRAQAKLDAAGVYDCQVDNSSQQGIELKVSIRFPAKDGQELLQFIQSKGAISAKIDLRLSKLQP